MAELLRDYFTGGWRERVLECACGWRGDSRAMVMDLHDEVTDYACPQCANLLLIVNHPGLEDVRRAAEAGHPEAREHWAILQSAGLETDSRDPPAE